MSLLDHLKTIQDPRKARGKRYDIPHLVLYSVYAVLSGAKGYTGIEQYIKAKYKTLNKIYDNHWISSPSGSAIQRILVEVVTEKQIEDVLRSYSKELLITKGVDMGDGSSSQRANTISVSVDGKTLRGSYDNVKSLGAVSLLSIIAMDTKLVLAQKTISGKESEMVEVQELLKELKDELGYSNLIITADALHTQKKQ